MQFSSVGFLLSPHYTWDPSSKKVYIAHITLWILLVYPWRNTKKHSVVKWIKDVTFFRCSDPGRIWVQKSLYMIFTYKILKINQFTCSYYVICVSYPSTASSRNQIKFNRGWTKGGPFSMDGCFSVYVLNTTEAPFLFFKQRNLKAEMKENRIKTWKQGNHVHTQVIINNCWRLLITQNNNAYCRTACATNMSTSLWKPRDAEYSTSICAQPSPSDECRKW